MYHDEPHSPSDDPKRSLGSHHDENTGVYHRRMIHEPNHLMNGKEQPHPYPGESTSQISQNREQLPVDLQYPIPNVIRQSSDMFVESRGPAPGPSPLMMADGSSSQPPERTLGDTNSFEEPMSSTVAHQHMQYPDDGYMHQRQPSASPASVSPTDSGSPCFFWNAPAQQRSYTTSPYGDQLRTLNRHPHEQHVPSAHEAVADSRRRSSLETFPESGINFPGCYILVPTTGEGNDPALSQSGEGSHKDGEAFGDAGKLVTKKARRPMADAERAEIRRNRKHGVCVRCKMFKERVCCWVSVCRDSRLPEH